MAELRYIQKGWEIDSIAPVFSDDPTDTEVGEIEAIHIYTAAEHEEVERLRALYRAMREPMAMIGMDKHIGPFSDEAVALLDTMNALDGGTYSKSEGS